MDKRRIARVLFLAAAMIVASVPAMIWGFRLGLWEIQSDFIQADASGWRMFSCITFGLLVSTVAMVIADVAWGNFTVCMVRRFKPKFEIPQEDREMFKGLFWGAVAGVLVGHVLSGEVWIELALGVIGALVGAEIMKPELLQLPELLFTPVLGITLLVGTVRGGFIKGGSGYPIADILGGSFVGFAAGFFIGVMLVGVGLVLGWCINSVRRV